MGGEILNADRGDGGSVPPLLRLGSGRVLLGGSALVNVVRALETAQHVTRRDGYGPSSSWAGLLEQLRAATGEVTAGAGSPAVPPRARLPPSIQDPISTAEAAGLLDCQPRNVRDLAARGVLDGRRIGGRLVFDRAGIAAEVLRRQER